MLTLITGAPGSGKSAALVSMLTDLGAGGRQIYVNGIPDLKIDHETLDEPERWHELVPDGSVVVIDEVQRIWRPRGPGQKVPANVALLETHRHRGLDFYIITQGPNLVDSNVRALVGRHVHLRDLGILGRWWYEWPETCDNCRTAWKNAPIKKRYKLPKQIFGQYKSASVHVKPIRSVPWMLAVMLVALVVVAVMSYVAYSKIGARLNPTVQVEKTDAEKLATIGNPSPSAAPLPPPEPVFIDDRVAFLPRISNKPETAPAYDAIRVIVNMPQVSGGVCFKGACKCLTQQGTDAGLTHDECTAWMKNPAFDHYRIAQQPTGAASARGGTPSAGIPSTNEKTSPEPLRTATMIPFPDGVSNPTADARESRIFPAAAGRQNLELGEQQPMPALSLQNPYRKQS